MKLEKSPHELIEAFAAAAPKDADVEHRKMFGNPGCFVNGNMFAGLHGSSVILRQGDERRAAVMAKSGASAFEPMPGRPMREYVVLPPAIVADKPRLEGWLAEAASHGRSLPPKDRTRARPK